MKSLLLGAVVGFILVGLVLGAGLSVAARAKVRQATAGWEPTAILVAKEDVPEGAPLSASNFNRIELPVMFVHDGHIAAADEALVIGAKPREPLLKGDPLVWSALAQTERWDKANDCVATHAEAFRAVVDKQPQEAFDAVSAAIEAAGKLDVEALPELRTDANGDAAVVVASADLQEGETITEQNTAVLLMPARFLTKSAVPASERKVLHGAKSLTQLQKNDVLRWPELEADQPVSFLACLRTAETQQRSTTKTIAAELARRYVEKSEAPR